MKIVFFGTPDFSAQLLKDLILSEFDIAAVVTMPDRAKKRSKVPTPPPVKQMLLDEHFEIDLYQPEKVSTSEMAEQLKKYQPDLFLVVGYGEILKEFILNIPKFASINVHTSLLPKYRGAAPLQRAIQQGEKEIGITIMEMVKAMDAGDVLAQASIVVEPDEVYQEIYGKIVELSKHLLKKVLLNFQEFYKHKKPQDPSQVTFANKILPQDLELKPAWGAEWAHNSIRAFSPTPGVWVEVELNQSRKRLKLLKTHLESQQKNEKIFFEIKQKELFLHLSDGTLNILTVQLEGKKPTSVVEFLKGVRSLSI